MRLDRCVAAVSMMAAGVLVLSACGGDHRGASTASAASVKVDCGGKQSLRASGSTAQANAMTRFVDAYQRACPGQTVTYTANGSGAGVNEFINNRTAFGGTDSPMTPDQQAKAGQRCGSVAWHLPVVFGPLAISYNINAVDTLVLDAPTLAKIFNGTITKWNDPAIARLNQSMPPGDIHVVYRSDESGSTDNFQQYLDAASDGAWGKGAGKTFKGATGVGATGNDGTAAAVKNTEGAITYNEWSFAQAQNLFTAKIVTSAGPAPVGISPASVGKTIAAAKVNVAGNDLVLDTSSFYKPTQAGAYPIVLATYEVVCSKYPEADVGKAVRAFLQSAIGPGQDGLADHGYVPLPADFQSKVSGAVNAIT
ncbi:phosphate ABC transporter substrate-binding protein PstS [Mycobacterium sp.]|jgi:phosphate transport system substrate-binding protein|uniref:phosphate ABC transporter substrate-binding protein PstS n=1 Tax=Mycobacterium sp. TaxID=1785 RepID=UPI002D31A4EC|nr:phosphate ABC transporter substrate-binding protein PstS [Mycobacterium sp.]HZA09475.1 phosphate ABC transporter substrate-binding protein PstS [Mycobacterium sp.]